MTSRGGVPEQSRRKCGDELLVPLHARGEGAVTAEDMRNNNEFSVYTSAIVAAQS